MKTKILILVMVMALLLLGCAAAAADTGEATAFIQFTSNDGTQAYWGSDSDAATGTTAAITKEGRYQVSVTFASPIRDIQFCRIAIQNGETKWPGGSFEVHSIRIDGKEMPFSKGFTFSDDHATTMVSLWDPWYVGGMNYDYNPRSYDGDLSDAGLMLNQNDFIGATRIEVEFAFHTVFNDEALVERLKEKGMDTKWNVVALIYRSSAVKGHEGYFTQKDVEEIKSHVIANIKPTLEGFAGGRMTVGTVETYVLDESVVSLDGNDYTTYGKGESADFDYLVEGKDVNLVVVFAPITNVGWAGIGGTYVMYGEQRVYVLTISLNPYADTPGTWKKDGDVYAGCMTVFVHEFLHCVETNSRMNGWGGFTAIHSIYDIGYDEWGDFKFTFYWDIMRDELFNGLPGFHPSSYYVTHLGGPAKRTGDKTATIHDADYELDHGQKTAVLTGYGDQNAVSFTVPDTIELDGNEYRVTGIGEAAFKKKLENLKEIIIGGNVKEIGKEAFSGCRSLDTVSGGESLEVIGERAFQQCAKLKEFVVPANVKTIGIYAFYACSRLAAFTFEGDKVKEIGENAFKGVAGSIVFTCPAKKLSYYKYMLKKSGVPEKAQIQ